MIRRPACRRAVTLTESALIFLVLLTLVLGMFDLGTTVMQEHLLTDTARYLARQASVRGELAEALGPWGPATIGPLPASDSIPACVLAASQLTADPSTVVVLVEWPDGGNSVGQRVRVTLTSNHELMVPQLWGGGPIPLQSSSTAVIVH